MRWPAPLEALVAANVAVFAAWVLGSPRWMTAHFEVSRGSLLRRPWTLLTAALSHSDLYSLIGNLQVAANDPVLSACRQRASGLHAPWQRLPVLLSSLLCPWRVSLHEKACGGCCRPSGWGSRASYLTMQHATRVKA